jgi:hypothetical protein
MIAHAQRKDDRAMQIDVVLPANVKKKEYHLFTKTAIVFAIGPKVRELRPGQER